MAWRAQIDGEAPAAVPGDLNVALPVDFYEAGADAPGFLSDDGPRPDAPATGDDRHAGLHYARLFPGNLSQGISKNVGMIVGDSGNDAGSRADYVGRIPPAAQSHLYHSNVDFLLGKVEKRGCRYKLKEREAGVQPGLCKQPFFARQNA